MKKTVAFFLVLVLFLFFLPGCQGAGGEVDSPSKDLGDLQVRFLVSRDFGREILLDKKVNYQKEMSVLDGLLETGAEVKTTFGGGFVDSLNGLEAGTGGIRGERRDWFYYVNGIFADVGALDYYLQPGETVWWDYHSWAMSQGTSAAVIGCYPEPFVHGYRHQDKTTAILHAPGARNLGLELEKALQEHSVSDLEVQEVREGLLAERRGPAVIVGEWEELRKIPGLKELNDSYARNGTFIHFEEKGLRLFNSRGEAARTMQGSTGVIAATGEGSGDDSPLWLVSGTDKMGMEAALKILVERPEEIFGAYSVAVTPQGVIRLPLTE